MRIFFLLFSVLVITGETLFAQDRSVYEGPYTFQEIEGLATYEFLDENDQDQVMDGFFRFDYQEKDSLDQTILYKFQVTGEHDKNKRSGTWIFDEEKHQIIIEDVVDFELIHSLISEEVYVEAVYEEGIKTGVWTFKENVFVDGELAPKADATGISFSDGKIVENIDYRNFEGDFTQLIRGEINTEGFMDGEWSLVYLDKEVLVSEVRNYENGFLLGIRRRNLESGEGIDEVIFYETIGKLRRLQEGDANSFKIANKNFGLPYNDGFQSDRPQLKIQQAGNAFIDSFISRLLQYDEVSPDPLDGERYPFFTRRFEYNLDGNQERLLSSILEKYKSLEDSVSKYAALNALELNAEKSDSLAFTNAYFKNRSRKLDQMKEFIGLINSDDIRYYDLENFTRGGINFLSPMEVIGYTYGEQQKRQILNMDVGYGGKSGFLEVVDSYLDAELNLTTQLASFANEELHTLEVNSRLLALEEEISEQRALVETLYQNHKAINEEEKQFFDDISDNFLNNGFNELLKTYAEADNSEVKSDQGKILLDFLNEMEVLYPALSAIFPRNENLDELYKEETFDPFTYTRYKARAKERLYEAGAVKLFDHYLKQLVQESDYTLIIEHINQIELLQQKMTALREVSTKSLERKIGRSNNPNRIAALLDL